jgi:hypothetical protein
VCLLCALAGHNSSVASNALGVASHPSSASLQPSNVVRLPLGVTGLCRSAGLEIDPIRLQEEMYAHAARSFVGRMKPDVSTHDTTMQGLGALLGNTTVVNTSTGEIDTRSLPSSRRNHRATSNRLRIDKSYPNQTIKRKKARKSNLYPGGAPPKDPPRDAQDASHARAPFASLNSPSLILPRDASFPPHHGSSSDPISIDDRKENSFFQRSGLSDRTASDLVQGAKRRSLEPSATMIFSCESDEEDDKLPVSTPEKKKGIARLSYMSHNRELTVDIAQGVIDLAGDKGLEPDSQDLCTMIDQILDSK